MDSIADEYSIIYQKHRKKQAYEDGKYLPDFVNEVCRMHRKVKAELEELKKERSAKEVVFESTKNLDAIGKLAELRKILLDNN